MFKKMIVLFLVFLFPSTLMASGKYAGKKILYVDSYHEGFGWSDGITNAIQETLKDTGVEFRIFRMDSKRNSSETYIKSAASKAKDLIEAFGPDVVIASDDNASKYLIMPYYKDADLPFVFCGVNWDASVYGFPYKNVTGMVEVGLTPQIITHLKKYAKGDKIGFMSVDTLTERKNMTYHDKIFKIRYTQAYLVKTFEEWKEKFLKIQDETDMVVMTNFIGIEGWNNEQAESFAETHTKVPAGTDIDWTMPLALMGATRMSEEQGRWSAKAALKILDGVSPSRIPLTRNKQGKLFFNMRIAKKLGIKSPPPFATLLK